MEILLRMSTRYSVDVPADLVKEITQDQDCVPSLHCVYLSSFRSRFVGSWYSLYVKNYLTMDRLFMIGHSCRASLDVNFHLKSSCVARERKKVLF